MDSFASIEFRGARTRPTAFNSMFRPKFSIRFVLLLTSALAIMLGVGIELNRRLENFALNPYRLQATGDILVAFLKKEDRWPADWSDLKAFIESNGNHLYGVRTFRELQENIRINFSFDPDSTMTESDDHEDEARMNLVVSIDGKSNGATRDPNPAIYRYLETRRRRSE